MRVAAIAVVCSVVVLCGCAGNRGFGPSSSTGGSAASSSLPDTTPSLGNPFPSFPSQDSSSSYKPKSGGGTVLGFPDLPAAFQDDATRRAPRTAQFSAPDP